MPQPFELNETVSSIDQLSRLATRFLGEFETDLFHGGTLNADILVHRTPSAFHDPSTGHPSGVKVSQPDGPRPTIHLYAPDLMGIPASALQGWIDLELAAILLHHQKDLFQFNFRREIMPLMNVSGTAKQFIRYLVFHLEVMVKNAKAVELLLHMAHGLPLCAYYYLNISPSNEDRNTYGNLVPHHWTRAIFISKKCKSYAAVILLEHQGIWRELESYWWACHDYILPEDQRLMKKMAGISHQFNAMGFSKQVVALFETIKSDLLMRLPL